MKVAIVTDGLFPDTIGGIQKYTLQLVSHLATLDLEITVFTQFNSPQAKAILSEYSNVELMHIIPSNSNFTFGKYISALYSYSAGVLSKVREIGDFDIVYCQGMAGIAMGIDKIAEQKYLHIIHNFHGLEMFQKQNGIKANIIAQYFRFIMNRIVKKNQLFVALGGKLAEILKNIKSDVSVKIIPNAISDDWFYNKVRKNDNQTLQFLFVGRYEWRKGLETLYAAVKMLDSRSDFEIHIVGDIPDSKRISDQRIHYQGAVKDQAILKQHFENAHILLCPSYAEGMPTVILEGLAMKLPVIATNVGATADIVNADHGILIPPFNAVKLAEAMEQMLEFGHEKRTEMGEKGAKFASEKFTWEVVAKQHYVYFNQLILQKSNSLTDVRN